jgi:hypothetical protein
MNLDGKKLLSLFAQTINWNLAFSSIRNVNTDLLKLQCLQNKVLHTIGTFLRRTPDRELHKAFNITYIYDYITKLCRQQAEVIQNHENVNVRNIGQGEAQHRKHTRLKLGGGQAYGCSSV